jgi:hypothetical protein
MFEKMLFEPFYSEEGKGGGEPTPPPEPPAGEGKKDEPPAPPEPPKKVEFTPEQQEAMNKIIQDRLKKADDKRKKAEEEAALREQGKYKDLLDAKENEMNELKQNLKQERNARLLIGEGYNEKQLAFALRNLEGNTEEEVKASLVQLKEVFPPAGTATNYGDPKSLGGGQKQQHQPVDNEARGKEMAKKILEKRRKGTR